MPNLYPCNKKGSGGAASIVSITVTTQPTKRNYAVNGTLDLTGIVVTALFSNGNTANITSVCEFSPADGSTLATGGVQTITASYDSFSTTTSVNVITAIAATTAPTKFVYAPNDTLNLAGLVISGTCGDTTIDITSECTFSPDTGDTLTTAGMTEVVATFATLTAKFYVNVTSSSLESYTWAQIRSQLVAGTLENIASVGDTKTIALTSGEIMEMQLASINDGTGSAGTYYPNKTADWISSGLMTTSHKMNTTNTNVGGWNSSEMRTYLNTDVYALIPSDLKNIIVDKTHMRTEGNQSTSLISADDKLWLPTEWECFGSAIYGGESATYNNHYAIFPDANSRKKYKKGATSAASWWESSPHASYTTYFCFVTNDGNANSYTANSTYGVVLGLRIG